MYLWEIFFFESKIRIFQSFKSFEVKKLLKLREERFFLSYIDLKNEKDG